MANKPKLGSLVRHNIHLSCKYEDLNPSPSQIERESPLTIASYIHQTIFFHHIITNMFFDLLK